MKKWKVVLLIGGSTLLVGLSVFAVTVFHIFNSVESTMDRIYAPLERDKPDFGLQRVPDPSADKERNPDDLPALIAEGKPINVLIMGVDQRTHDRGRSDTLMLLAINPHNNSTLLFNIPRDTRTAISRHGEDKINHAYAFGGIPLAVETVENFLQVPIDYYVMENMEGFEKLVDQFGTISVDNAFAFDYKGKSFPQGTLSLTGNDALLYSRMRYDDPRGDFGRNTRQRQVVKALIKNALSLNSLTRLSDILDNIADSAKTDIRFSDAKKLFLAYGDALRTIDTTELHGKGTMINGIYYFVPDPDEKAQLRERLIAQLELEQVNG